MDVINCRGDRLTSGTTRLKQIDGQLDEVHKSTSAVPPMVVNMASWDRNAAWGICRRAGLHVSPFVVIIDIVPQTRSDAGRPAPAPTRLEADNLLLNVEGSLSLMPPS